MKIRNAKYNKNKTIDCEIEHPDYGWIPFTASPNSAEEYNREMYAMMVKKGGVEEYTPPTQAELDAIAHDELEQIKSLQKAELIKQKMEALLGDEFAEIDKAKSSKAVKAVKL